MFVAFSSSAFSAAVVMPPVLLGFFFQCVFCIPPDTGQLVLLETSLNCGHTLIPLSSYLEELA